MNYWEQKFRKDSAEAEFGTFMGNHTIQELKDLIAAKDVDMAQLNKQQADFTHTWMQSDPAACGLWLNDLQALNNRYDAAKASANTYLTISAADFTAGGSEASYNAILDALNPMWRQNTSAPGSYGDLITRITAAGAKIQAWQVPQPTPNSDYDLNTYKASDTAVKGIEHAASVTSQTVMPIVVAAAVGLVALVLLKR